MRRLILLAIVLSGAIWMSTRASLPPTAATQIAAPSDVSHGTQGAGESEQQQWRAGSMAIAPAGQSFWKHSTVHADLAHAPSATLFAMAPARAPDLLPHATPHYLKHTPLLI